MSYYLKSIELTNIGIFTKQVLNFGPGVNIISGDNHTGKTTVLHACMTFFEGGSCGELVSHGQSYGEVKITFSDDCTAWKRVTLAEEEGGKDTVEIKVRGPHGEKIDPPGAWLQERVPKGSFDVEEFLHLDPHKRAQFIIDRIAVSFSAEEINAILAMPIGKTQFSDELLPKFTQPLGLDKFNEVYKTIEEFRKTANIAMRDKNALLESLRSSSLSGADDKDWAKEVAAIQQKLTATEKEIATVQADIRLEAEQARAGMRKDAASDIAEIEQAIAKLKQSISDRNLLLAVDIQRADKAEAESIAEQTEELHKAKSVFTQDLGTAQAKADQQQQAAGLKKRAEQVEEESKGLILKHLRRDTVLKSLDKAKNEKLKQVEIDGFNLTYNSRKQPVITIHGTPIEQLSGQESLYLAFECVTLESGSGQILFLDDIERITDTYRKPLIEQCKSGEFQLLATLPVAGQALKVEVL